MVRPDNFSYSALHALFDYFDEIEEDTGEEMELDVIGICCEYAEYDTAFEAATEYGFETDESDDDERETLALDWLRGQTTAIGFQGGVIIQNY